MLKNNFLQKKKNLAVVLSGGSARGLAHIGVLEVFDEHKIPIDVIVGTSMGALVGGIYAAGNLKEFKEEIINISKSKIKAWSLTSKLIKPNSSSEKVAPPFISKYVKNKRIEDLGIDFTAVATDLKTGKEVYINKGSLLKAIVASISIPGIFHPVRIGNKFLVDGGIVDPLPQSYGLIKAKKIIAVNAIPRKILHKRKPQGVFNILYEVSGIITNTLINLEGNLVNLTSAKRTFFIQLKTEQRQPFDFYNVREVIDIGRKEAEKNIKKIIRFINE